MHVARLLIATVALVLAAPTGAALAAPGADVYTGAPPLTFSLPGGGSNAGFGAAGEPTTGCSMVATAWWRIAGNGQTITLSTNGSEFDSVLAVYNQGVGGPSDGNRIACNDDAGPIATTSQVSFGSQRGTSYLVQVGGTSGSETGPMVLTASAPRPVNDDRAAAQALATGVAASVSNLGATREIGELETCGTAPFAATTWYRWTAPATGDAVFDASAAFGDTVLTVYRADSGAAVGCNDDAATAGGSSRVTARVTPGDYLLQIGAKGADSPATPQGAVTGSVGFTLDPDVDNDGELASTDCDDNNPTIRHSVVDVPDDGIDQDCDGADAVDFDRDRDGSLRPRDCNDADPAIRPGTRDIPGNKVDEDCLDGPAPYPVLRSSVRSFAVFPPYRFTSLTVVKAVAGSRIELRCSGAKCFKRKVIRVKKSSRLLSLLRYVKQARLKRGAVVQVRITKPATVGVVRRITVRGGTRPAKLEDLCLPVGKTKPQAC